MTSKRLGSKKWLKREEMRVPEIGVDMPSFKDIVGDEQVVMKDVRTDIYRGVTFDPKFYHRWYNWVRYKTFFRRFGRITWTYHGEKIVMAEAIHQAGMRGNFQEWYLLRKRVKLFCKIHWGFKYKWLMPVMKLAKWKTGDIVYKPTDVHATDPCDRNLRVFEKSFEEALYVWYLKWYPGTYRNINAKGPDFIKAHADEKMSCPTSELLRSMKNIAMIPVIEDTAYRELFNIMMLVTYKNMAEEYGGTAVHLFFTDKNSQDLQYFIGQNLLHNKELRFKERVSQPVTPVDPFNEHKSEVPK